MRHRQAIALLSLVGWFVSVYLWLYKIGAIGELQCGAGGCETVQLSRYAVFLGVPVAFYGVAGYAALFALSLLGVQERFRRAAGIGALLLGMSAVGVLFSAYLTYLELFVIHAICRWCVVSAVLMTAIFLVALHGFVRERTAPGAGRRIASSEEGGRVPR